MMMRGRGAFTVLDRNFPKRETRFILWGDRPNSLWPSLFVFPGPGPFPPRHGRRKKAVANRALQLQSVGRDPRAGDFLYTPNEYGLLLHPVC